MPSIQELKANALREIDSRAGEIIGISRSILDNPEPGFREVKTSALVAATLKEMGVPIRENIALTGIKGEIRGEGNGPSVAVIGELDS